MPLELFYDRLKLEGPLIDEAIRASLDELPEPVRPVAAHIIGAGGKRLRPLLTVLGAALLGFSDKGVYRLGSCMEMLHAATLLHDDVLDGADARRGNKAAHIVFGTEKTILAGDALLACGNSIVASFGSPALCICYSRATARTAAGEILEMDSLRRPDLSREQYLEIAKGKTACLISESCLLGALAANADDRAARAIAAYGENLGIGFQLVDDALDFSPSSHTGKPRGGDLREGKLTLPLRLYRDSLTVSAMKQFDEKFRQNSFSEREIETIIERAADFSGEVRAQADSFLEQAKNSLADFPDTPEKDILRQMADYIGARDK